MIHDTLNQLRGQALIDHAAENLTNFHFGDGLSEAEISKLTLNGKPLPPSLTSYLRFDTALVDFDFQPKKLSELANQYDAFKAFDRILTGDCFSMRASHSDKASWFLYAGCNNERGEYPIFFIDIDDLYLLGMAYSGFDIYFADQFSTNSDGIAMLEFDDQDALKRQSNLNFFGYSMLELFGDATLINGDRVPWENTPTLQYLSM
jgi:hypothetical protein